MIYLNLIPRNLWYLNLRKMLSDNSWKILSTRVREGQEYTCFSCKITLQQLKSKKYFHAHEAWWFNDEIKVVTLKGILCLCSKCHQATHFGYAGVKNKADESFNRIMSVNKWERQMANDYIDYEFEVWSKRSNINWKIDINSFNKWLIPKEIEEINIFIIKNPNINI